MMGFGAKFFSPSAAAFIAVVFMYFSASAAEPKFDEASRLAASAKTGERIQAAAMLPDFRNSSVLPMLDALILDNVPAVRAAAVRSAARMNASKKSPVSVAAEKIAPLLSDPDNSVRLEAIETLGQIGNESALEYLHAHLGKCGGAEKITTISAISKHRSAKSVPVFAQLLDSEREGVRDAACRGLHATALLAFDNAAEWKAWFERSSRLGRAGWLKEALVNGRPINRVNASLALFKECGEEAIGYLIWSLTDNASGVREAVNNALCAAAGLDFKYDPDADAAARVESVRTWKMWWSGAAAKGRRGWLLDALKAGSAKNKSRAAKRLIEYRDTEVVFSLIAALDDEWGGVREAAFGTLKTLASDGFGYSPDDPLEKRRIAMERFREWAIMEFSSKKKK